MKNSNYRFLFPLGFLVFLVACSTKKNTFLARSSHALATEYNILYNGQIALDQGVKDIKDKLTDNFWMRLPVEKMQYNTTDDAGVKTNNPNFSIAEEKATKAIQKHSMLINGRERNTQIDEAYLLLGKARYYDQRFIPALDAFNFILYKYTNSSNIDEAKIWREKTNMRLGNDALVINNMRILLDNKQLKKQVFADANALMAEAFLNIEEKDSAVAKLKLAIEFTKKNEDKGRYNFILGQLYEELAQKDNARECYNNVIDLNRKIDRKYLVQAHLRKAELFDSKKGDTTAFVKHFNKLLADRENRPFLDLLNYQMGVFYDQQGKQIQATKYYNQSLNKAKDDDYLIASDYRNLGNLYFKDAKYLTASKYYDSTLVRLNPKTREFLRIQKVRTDLDEVIFYEDIAVRNDSILNVVSMSPEGRVAYYQGHIDKIKKADEAKQKAIEEAKEKQKNIDRNNSLPGLDPLAPPTGFGNKLQTLPTLGAETSIASSGNALFYFYNPTTVSYGKIVFKKNWGNRTANGNWRMSNQKNTDDLITTPVTDSIDGQDAASQAIVMKPEYTTDFYIKTLPKTDTEIASLSKERNTAYYQLGVIYKEKLKEYELAAAKLEQLLKNNPEEKLILPSHYNLYKIYQIIAPEKAVATKQFIVSQYPESRYAQIISNPNQDKDFNLGSPDDVYNKLYAIYEKGDYATVLNSLENLITQYSGEEIVSKFELLKATAIGKVAGVQAYKKSLQFVATNYPNSIEGKKATLILNKDLPVLEAMVFTKVPSNKWNILFKVGTLSDQQTVKTEAAIKKWKEAIATPNLSYSFDHYTLTDNFITIHGLRSEAEATEIANYLKNTKEFSVDAPYIAISTDNYKVVQINKNLEDFVEFKKQ